MRFKDADDVLANQLALGLLQIHAVELRPSRPFTWSSGWKSPIYCDNRLILSFPVLRTAVVKGLCAAIRTCFPGSQLLAGTSTAGIPHAAFAAYQLGLPMVYVRGSAKSHGTGKQIEGLVRAGDRVVVIEDTVSTGASAFAAVEVLRQEGAEVVGVLSIFSYDFDVAIERAQEMNVPVCRLLDYDRLISVALQEDYIQEEQRKSLLQWRKDPASYGVRNDSAPSE